MARLQLFSNDESWGSSVTALAFGKALKTHDVGKKIIGCTKSCSLKREFLVSSNDFGLVLSSYIISDAFTLFQYNH